MDICKESSKDIKILVNDINNDSYKKDRWTRYIVDFHEQWKKDDKDKVSINVLNEDRKYIWGKLVVLDSDDKIEDIFKEGIDNITVKFFTQKNKNLIKDIKENDLIKLMYQSNFGFIRFKRMIDVLFKIDRKNSKIVKNEKNQHLNYETDLIGDIKNRSNDFSQSKNVDFRKDSNLIKSKIKRSMKNITNGLESFDEIVDNYESYIVELKNEVNIKEKEIEIKEREVKTKDKEIGELKYKIKDLNLEIKENKKTSDELQNVRITLGAIKNLIENENIF